MRLDDAIDWFFECWPYEGPRVPSKETVRTYHGHLAWLSGFAATERRYYATDLTADLLRLAFKEILSHASKDATNYKGGEAKCSGIAFAARALARWLVAQDIPMPDLSKAKPPKVPERIQPRVRPDEFRALEHAVLRRLVDTKAQTPRLSICRDLALLYLLSDTGMRADEVCSMRVQDVDLYDGQVFVRRGKGGKQRALSIKDAADPHGGDTLRRLAEWVDMRSTIRRCSSHEMLWCSVRGTPMSTDQLRYVLKVICERAGIDGSRPPHAFRRAQFTERYRANPESLSVLRARMGWSDKSHEMVQTYIRGAEVDLAATETLPSLAATWHSRLATIGANPGNERPRPIAAVRTRQGRTRST